MTSLKRVGLALGGDEELRRGLETNLASYPDLTAEVLSLGGVNDGWIEPCDVIVDRVSHHIPFYSSYLRQAERAGCRVINSPSHPAVRDRFAGLDVARRAGLEVTRSVLLPQHDYHPAAAHDGSLRHLEYPLRWDKIVEWTGFPARLRPVEPGAPIAEHTVHSLDELWRAFDQTGSHPTFLQRIETGPELVGLCVGTFTDVRAESGASVDDALLRAAAVLAQRLRRAFACTTLETRFEVRHGQGLVVVDAQTALPALDRVSLGAAYDEAVLALASAVAAAARRA